MKNMKVSYWLQFQSDVVPPGGSVVVHEMPQKLWKSTRWEISEGHRAFVLDEVLIGNRGQKVIYDPIPVENLDGAPAEFEACNVAERVTLKLRNVSGRPARFVAKIHGESPKDV